MRVGERGQVTIPKPIRDRFGIIPATEVEFRVVSGAIVLEKTTPAVHFRKWQGRCRKSLTALGYASVDEYMEDVRGR